MSKITLTLENEPSSFLEDAWISSFIVELILISSLSDVYDVNISSFTYEVLLFLTSNIYVSLFIFEVLLYSFFGV